MTQPPPGWSQPQPPYPPTGWRPPHQPPPPVPAQPWQYQPWAPPRPQPNLQQMMQNVFQAPQPPQPAFFNNPVHGPVQLNWLDGIIRRPAAPAHVVVLYLAPSGELVISGSPRDQRHGERESRVYRAYYHVNVGRHPLPVRSQVPAAGDSFHFTADVAVTWQVTDAILVVRQGLTDVRAALVPLLLARLATVTRRFDIERCAEAEEAANQDLAAVPVGSELGLWTSCTVRLALDEDSLAYLKTLRQNQREFHTTEGAFQVTRLRAAFFAQYLQDGDVARFAVQLAMNPEQAPDVIAAMNEQDRAQLQMKAETIRQLIDQGHLQPHEYERPLDIALDQLSAMLTGPTRPMGTQPPTAPPVAPPPPVPPYPPRDPRGGERT